MLMSAGANTEAGGGRGTNFFDLYRRALKLHVEFQNYSSQYIAKVVDHGIASMIQKRKLEIKAMKEVVDQMELAKVIKLAQKEREKLIKLHDQEQADYCEQNGDFDQSQSLPLSPASLPYPSPFSSPPPNYKTLPSPPAAHLAPVYNTFRRYLGRRT